MVNTNLATATALLTWVVLDLWFGIDRKPTFLGTVNGMITGLVAITPTAGYVNGLAALLIGLIASTLVWLSWNKLSKLKPFSKVDDALDVVHTHGMAGLTGGLWSTCWLTPTSSSISARSRPPTFPTLGCCTATRANCFGKLAPR